MAIAIVCLYMLQHIFSLLDLFFIFVHHDNSRKAVYAVIQRV